MGKLGQFGRGQAFILVIHGQVGVVPVAQHSQALELVALDVNELGGVLTAKLAHLQLGDLILLGPQVLFHLQLDRQAMAIPAWHVRGMKALHALDLEDEVLENLVEGMADMDMAIGVGRAVVQYIDWLGRTFRFHLLVQAVCLP